MSDSISGKIKLALLPVDLLLIAMVFLLPVSWLMEQVVLDLRIARITVSWEAKLIAFFVLLLALRIALTIVGKKVEQPVRGCVGHPAVGPFLLGVMAIFLLLFGWEKLLERQGFSAEIPAIVIIGEDTKPEPKSKYFYKDPELLWRWRPGAMFNGRPVNQMGFLDREVDPEKKEGTLRVICMGCSITGQGPPPYSGYLNDYLNAEEPGKWDSFNMGVHGYSTSQGLRLFQNRTAALKPDYVTIMFGWNDHWRARAEDSKRMARRASKWQASLYNALQKKRFFQYIVKKNTPIYENVLNDDEFVLRVPPEEYRKNLHAFIKEVRDVGAVPILIAAPRRKKLSELLVKNRQVASISSGIELHDQYLKILYEVAEETDTALVDLPNILEPELVEEQMTGDGIHFRPEGLKRIAQEIQKKIAEIRAGQ
ncbi:MAG: GDSL-type esterase/lipase family protein [Desulfobulbaceae bacterium]|nr:GDSL-type esterase/lipase family protein [Desulfobulbaceae bacterium]